MAVHRPVVDRWLLLTNNFFLNKVLFIFSRLASIPDVGSIFPFKIPIWLNIYIYIYIKSCHVKNSKHIIIIIIIRKKLLLKDYAMVKFGNMFKMIRF